MLVLYTPRTIAQDEAVVSTEVTEEAGASTTDGGPDIKSRRDLI